MNILDGEAIGIKKTEPEREEFRKLADSLPIEKIKELLIRVKK